MRMKKMFDTNKPIIGMVHLSPLPGTPKNKDSIKEITKKAVHEAKIYYNAGFDGILIENFGDVPFYPEMVGPETVAYMTHIASEIARRIMIPMGIQVLRNDTKAGLSVAHAVGADFIRVNVLGEAMLTDTGIIRSRAYDTLRFKKLIGADDVKIFADVQVKHATPLAKRDIAMSAEDLIYRCLADALIITGPVTGANTDLKKYLNIKSNPKLKNVPILIGGGTTKENINEYLQFSDGIIVGTSLKSNGISTNPLNPKRAKEFMDKVKKIRGS